MKKSQIEINGESVKYSLETGNSMFVQFRWGVSRGRDTYGYNICSCIIDGEKVGTSIGGGYDMQGASFGEFLRNTFYEELKDLSRKEKFYGLEDGYVDGACGLNCMIDIFIALGYNAEYKYSKSLGNFYYISKKGENNGNI
jgi:hypothetical protein